eukprot:GHVT01049683.1.p2 GENE.GHVT01049683.1~~GHVT01049683.1.p2  ORF type:complete len:149 (-),score=53.03 GHVT01049683.1:63-509(-)
MGNQLLKEYEADGDASTAQAIGPYEDVDSLRYLRWKLLPGRHVERKSERVSLFVFDTRSLDRVISSASASSSFVSSYRRGVLEALRNDARMAQKLRHPSLLSVVEPLHEDSSSLAFATRLVQGTLAAELYRTAQPQPAASDGNQSDYG